MAVARPQCGALVGPGGAAGEPGRAGQVGGAGPGRRARRHGGAGAHAVGAGLRPVGQPAALRRRARPQAPQAAREVARQVARPVSRPVARVDCRGTERRTSCLSASSALIEKYFSLDTIFYCLLSVSAMGYRL